MVDDVTECRPLCESNVRDCMSKCVCVSVCVCVCVSLCVCPSVCLMRR